MDNNSNSNIELLDDDIIEIQNSEDEKENEEENEEEIENISILKEMGFNEVLIKKVYIFLKPNSLEQAINYMSEENGIYQHNFFQNIKISNKQCYICGHPENEHINYNELTKDDELEEEIKGKSSIGNKLCSICFETYAPYDMYELKKCHHEYCYNCWFIHLKNKIENSEIGKLKCIDLKCKEIIPEEFILDIIKKDKKLVEKYKRFSKRLKILEDPNKVFCPEPNCDSYAIKNKKIKYVKCENGHNFCCICMKKPHGKNSCENELEKDFQIWKKGKIIKQCPKCNIWTEKNEGCNHMTCAECKYQWCWLCGGKYTSNHYSQGKCNGLQFAKPKSEKEIQNLLNNNNNNNKCNCCDLDERILENYENPMPFHYRILYLILYFFYTPCLASADFFLNCEAGEGFSGAFYYFTEILIYFIYGITFSVLNFCIMSIISLPILFYPCIIKKYKIFWYKYAFHQIHLRNIDDVLLFYFG